MENRPEGLIRKVKKEEEEKEARNLSEMQKLLGPCRSR
jgi:hypothetical protein